MKRLTKIRVIILSKGLSQRKIAQDIGIDETLLSKIVNLRIVPTKDEQAKIAKRLSKSTNELFDESGLPFIFKVE